MSMVSVGFTAVSSRFQAVSVFRETIGFSFGFAVVSLRRIPIKSVVSAWFRRPRGRFRARNQRRPPRLELFDLGHIFHLRGAGCDS